MGNDFTTLQEYKDLKKLGDSLLTRSGKISDLIAKLESAVHEKDDQSPEKKRAQRSRTLFLSQLSKTLCFLPFPLVLQLHAQFPASLRSLKGLEQAVQILEDQFEKIEEVKADVSELLTPDIEPRRKSQYDTY